jgi:uncharacterized membrane protein YeaQ/YmgE (transglycosylase-associated protein family)
MGFIIWLIVGGVVGWLASLIMRTDAQQGIILNIVVGIVGAVIAGLLLGKGNINGGLTIETFLWSLLGAVFLLAVVNLIRRVTVRFTPKRSNPGKAAGEPARPFLFSEARTPSRR